MLTWNLREAGISARLMHNSLVFGAIIQRQGTRNARHVVWTEILQLCSSSLAFLLTMWILHAKLRYGQILSVFLLSHLTPQGGSVMCPAGQPPGMQVRALSIWRRFQTLITSFSGQCPKYHWSFIKKNGMSTASWQPSKGRSSAHLGSCAERQNILAWIRNWSSERVGRFLISADFLAMPMWHPVQCQFSEAIALSTNFQVI